VDSEEGFHIGERMGKNLGVEKTFTRLVCGGFFLTCWNKGKFRLFVETLRKDMGRGGMKGEGRQ
jgi:hypothetical protein